jgi:proteasome accessory factor A
LHGLEADRTSVAPVVDWVAKERLVRAYQDRHALDAGDARLKMLDLQYHDMRPERCLARRVGLEQMVDLRDVEISMSEPPSTTRAYFRGKCLQKWPADIVAANWDSMVFDVGRDPLRRVPMMEPLRGTEDAVGNVIARSDTVSELIARLSS